MSLRNLCCLLLITSFITACGPMYTTTYSYVGPKDTKGQMCVMQCQQSKSLCQRLCSSESENCKSRAMGDARFKYEEYLSERRSQGKTAEKNMNSFYDSSECGRTCNCDDDYRSCFQLCGGQVIPQTTCTAFCN